jgi:hypothetical protein
MLEIISGVLSFFIMSLNDITMSLAFGAALIAALSFIYRKEESTEAFKMISIKVLAFSVVTQFIFKCVDILTTYNLYKYKDIAPTDVTVSYYLNAFIIFIAFALFFLKKHKKITPTLFVFTQAALWISNFVLLRNELFLSLSSEAVVVGTLISIAGLLLGQDFLRKRFLK